MSLLSADRLFIALQPDRVALVRQSGLWRRRVTAKQTVPCPPGFGWDEAVAALSTALTDPTWRRCKVELVLSARFVRTAIMPPLAGIRGGEATRLAQHCLQESNGEGSDGWHMTFGEAAWNAPRVVCAIDLGLLEALHAAVRAVQGRLVSVRPFAMSAFDSRRSYFTHGGSWFAAIEPGWCTLARIENGAWKSVRTRRLFSETGAEVSTLVAQEALLSDIESPIERIVIASPNAPHLGIPGFDAIPAALQPRIGFSPLDDAPVAMALEGN